MKLPFRRSRRGLRLPENRTLHGGPAPRPAPPRRALRGDPAPSPPTPEAQTPEAPTPEAPTPEAPPASAPREPAPVEPGPPELDEGPRRVGQPPPDEAAHTPDFDTPDFDVYAAPAPAGMDAPATDTVAPPAAEAPAAETQPSQSSDRRLSLLPHALPADLAATLGRNVARTGLTPNMLTVLGLLGTGAAAALAAYGHFWQAGLVMLAAGAFDLLDGAVARATGRATTWGAIFDAVSDRLGEFAMYLGLLVWFSAPAHFSREAVILIGVSIGGAMLVSYTRSKAGEYGVRLREGLGTRFERVVILAIGLFANEVIAVLWILAVLTNLTALQRWGVTWWALRRHQEASLPPAPFPPDSDAPDSDAHAAQEPSRPGPPA